MYEYMNMNMTFFHGFSMLLFWGVIIFIIFSLTKNSKESSKETPLEIIKKRLAKGDISKEQFDSLKKSIQ